jgi:hypothetical protein
LENWVTNNIEPPPSQVPRTGDGTAVARKEVLSGFGHAAAPDPASLPCGRIVNLGPDVERGIGRWPVKLGDTYVDLVSAIDADGNEIAGVRLPAVAAPLASYTGWNPRRHIDDLPDVLYERVGSKLPFAPGRPSVTERYPTRDDYAAAVRTAAETLVAQRFLLTDEVEAVVAKAVADY